MIKLNVHLRKNKLNRISQQIAMFIAQETFADEDPIRHLLVKAIVQLDKAADRCVTADLAARSEAPK